MSYESKHYLNKTMAHKVLDECQLYFSHFFPRHFFVKMGSVFRFKTEIQLTVLFQT